MGAPVAVVSAGLALFLFGVFWRRRPVGAERISIGLFALASIVFVLHCQNEGYIGGERDVREESIACIGLSSAVMATALYTFGSLLSLRHLWRGVAVTWIIVTVLPLSLLPLVTVGAWDCARVLLTVSALAAVALMFGGASLQRHGLDSAHVTALLGAVVVLSGVLFTVWGGSGWPAMYALHLAMVCIGAMMGVWVLVAIYAVRVDGGGGSVKRGSADSGPAAAGAQGGSDDVSLLMAMLSHEIKTALATLSLYVESESPSPEIRGHAKRAVIDIDALVERCTQAIRIDEGCVQVKARPVVFDDLVADVKTMHAHGHRIAYQPRGGKVGLVVHTDPLLLGTIISNLIDNALKYSPSDSHVEVVAEPTQGDPGPGLRVRIRNTVSAGAVLDASRMFQKYYRSPNARAISGSGLGLYIVDQLADRLGVRVCCRTEAGSCVFDVAIPNVRPQDGGSAA